MSTKVTLLDTCVISISILCVRDVLSKEEYRLFESSNVVKAPALFSSMKPTDALLPKLKSFLPVVDFRIDMDPRCGTLKTELERLSPIDCVA